MAVTQIRGSTQIISGSIGNTQIATGAAIATAKLADAANFILRDGSIAFTSVISGVTPTSAAHLTTKGYVDNLAAGGLDVKGSVRVATTAALTLATDFENGDTVDGVVLATGNRILIKNQASSIANGIYTVNASGAPTRATDADSNTDVTAGMFCFVSEGTSNADTGWVLTTNDADIDVGTNALDFTQFNGTGSFTAGDGLTLTGNAFSVNVDGTGIEINGDTLRLKDLGVTTGKINTNAVTYAKVQAASAGYVLLGNTSSGAGNYSELTPAGDITLGASSTFTIANSAVTTAKIDNAAVTADKLAAAVAGAGLAGGAGTALSVNVDDTGIEINSDTLRLKDAGVTSAKLAAAVAGAGIAGGAGTALSVDWVNATYTGDNAENTFALTGTPVLSSLMVFQNGQLMEGGGTGFDYAVVGTDVVFEAIPAAGDKIRFCFLK